MQTVKRYTIDQDIHLILLDLLKNKIDHHDGELSEEEEIKLDNLYWQLKDVLRQDKTCLICDNDRDMQSNGLCHYCDNH